MNQHVKPGKSERTEHGLTLTEPLPLSGIPAVWRLAALVSTLVMGALAIIAALYLGRSILLPVVAGLIVGITLAPAVKLGSRLSIPQPVSAMLVVLSVVAVIGLLITFFAAPLTEWIARAPEIGAAVQAKLRVFDYPIAVLHDIKNADHAGRRRPGRPSRSKPIRPKSSAPRSPRSRRRSASSWCSSARWCSSSPPTRRCARSWSSCSSRATRGCACCASGTTSSRIWSAMSASSPSSIVALGVVTTVMLYLVGFPNPVTFGLLTLVLNYIPYIGPAIVALVLFGVGVVAMPSLAYAALAPALFVAIATVEGHFITPSIVGRRLTMSPFLVFLALAFWTWLWGPIGAFLAMPLLIMSFVVLGHLLPREEGTIPG